MIGFLNRISIVSLLKKIIQTNSYVCQLSFIKPKLHKFLCFLIKLIIKQLITKMSLIIDFIVVGKINLSDFNRYLFVVLTHLNY